MSEGTVVSELALPCQFKVPADLKTKKDEKGQKLDTSVLYFFSQDAVLAESEGQVD